MNPSFNFAALALALVAGAAAFGPTPASARAPSAQLSAVDLTSADLEFVLQATRGSIFQVRAASLALRQSTDTDVLALAQRMLHDHGMALEQLRQIAIARGIALPDEPSHADGATLDGLGGLRGKAFDDQYLARAGVHEQRQAITLYHKELAVPNADAGVAQLAASILPVLSRDMRLAEATLQRVSSSRPPAQHAAGSDAQSDLREAVQVVHEMKNDAGLADLLREAKGVLILADYGRAALGIGIQAGEGVLVARHGASFSDPAFFDLAGISLGLQAGASAGHMALLLMTDRAVQQFRSPRRFSIDAAAGLTLGPYSARRQASSGKVQDVVVWSGADGIYAGGALSITEITADAEANRAYYGREVSASEILGGLVDNPHQNVLAMVLAA